MHKIDLRQGDLYIQLISDDLNFISRQMQRWSEAFLDPSLKPTTIPLGLNLIPPERPSQQPESSLSTPPLTAQSEPSIQLSVPVEAPMAVPIPSASEQELLRQIQSLQEQVQQLTRQVSQADTSAALPVQPVPIALEEIPPSTPEMSDAKVEKTPESPSIQLADENFSLEQLESSMDASIESFVSPAHADMMGTFEPFESIKPESPLPSNSFEQPVNNKPVSVENTALPLMADMAETLSLSSLTELDKSLHQPVENPLDTTFELAQADAPDISPSPNTNQVNDFDLLLNSLMSDLEPSKDTVDRPPAMEPSLTGKPSIPEPESPSQQGSSAVSSGLLGLKMDMGIGERPTHSPQMKSELRRHVALPESDSSGLKSLSKTSAAVETQFQEPSHAAPDPFEQELKSLFEETAEGPPSPDPNVQLYDPPQVDYDFGVPGPPPSTDPKIKQLSLEVLENQDSALTNYESPFPPLEEDDEPAADTTPYQPMNETLNLDKAPIRVEAPMDEEMGAFATAFPEPESLEDDLSHVETLVELCEMAPNATTASDYLLLTAYFLSTIQHVEKYALKDINTQLVRSGLTPMNYGTLESVISQGHMQLVPDLTGTASAAEYTLTEKGYTYAESLLNA